MYLFTLFWRTIWALLREGHDVAHLEKAKSANEFDDHLPKNRFHSTKWLEISTSCTEKRFRIQWGTLIWIFLEWKIKILGKSQIITVYHCYSTFFSHRIDHFSFGDPTSGLLYPLDGDLVLQDLSNTQFNYIINVVPTRIKTFK